MTRIAIATALLLLMPLAAQAQSFNCRHARTADEVLICQDGQLGALDEHMSDIYFRVRNSRHGGARANLEAEQSGWLRSRQRCGRDAACIGDSYRQRIRELLDY
jgi:uncharacterized protein